MIDNQEDRAIASHRSGAPSEPQGSRAKPPAAIAEHTPGPWHVAIDDDGNSLSGRPGVYADDQYDCAIVHWDGFVQEYWRSARGDKEIHANARLIAAAPELLSALRRLAGNAGALRAFEHDIRDAAGNTNWQCLMDAVADADAAIAKAEGRS